MTTPVESLDRLRATGRNDDCPCGSGKKYKKCHQRDDEAAASKALAESNAKILAEAQEHVHDETCAHDDEAAASRPAPGQSSGPAGARKQPLSHKPMNTPRKAV